MGNKAILAEDHVMKETGKQQLLPLGRKEQWERLPTEAQKPCRTVLAELLRQVVTAERIKKGGSND